MNEKTAAFNTIVLIDDMECDHVHYFTDPAMFQQAVDVCEVWCHTRVEPDMEHNNEHENASDPGDYRLGHINNIDDFREAGHFDSLYTDTPLRVFMLNVKYIVLPRRYDRENSHETGPIWSDLN